MKIDNSFHIKAAKQNLKRELEHLNTAHQHELEHAKVAHDERKNQIRNDYQADLARIENESRKKLLEKNFQNEETLSKLQDSLTDVKTRIENEKAQIQNLHEQQKEEERLLFESQIQNRRIIDQAKLDDLHHEAQIEQQKLSRSKQYEKEQIEFNATAEQKQNFSNHKLKVEASRDLFDKEYHAQVDKYRNVLKNQKSDFEKEAVSAERQHQLKTEHKQKVYETEADLIQANGNKKLTDLQKRYEAKFEENFNLTQKSLQELEKKRIKLENDLITSMKDKVEFEIDKESDPFYKFQKLVPKLSVDTDKKAYVVEIKATPEAARDYKLTAHDRELKLQMKRDYEFANTDKRGVASSVNKYESFSTKIPVEDIVDGKKVTKSYKDGILKFEIKLA